ncbi:MAG: nucleotidyltransferase family protein [Candidatus Auribacterota bacterium]
MKTLDELKLILDKQKEHIITAFDVAEIGIFGSYATSKQTEKSDIDIIVEFKKGSKTFDNYMGLKLYLEDLFESKVDLVSKHSIRQELKQSILSGTIYVF